jgi:dipeptidyl aminopeptidase/acylaminoacyl peptidase
VHGAGYLQNVHARWPVYFREQMFNELLVQHGYVVLDLDYRGSEGYGRDWRTAIYRQMGHPELEDYLDGIDWLVETQQGDRERVGIYGGSYGGFMAFMALFRAPDAFHAGAALRPVTDWTMYNHGYTSNILNTPDLDPEAYAKSSPIEYADNLRGQLLIAHGMIDDNVFYQDSVRLAQRLIELRKDGWELASYPLERHGYVHPESWYDQYRRIFELFERTLQR